MVDKETEDWNKRALLLGYDEMRFSPGTSNKQFYYLD